MTKTVGILALQGDFAEHNQCLQKCEIDTILVRKSSQLNKIDGLIIPGGESTAMTKIAQRDNLIEPLKEFTKQKAVWGTCAGLILLADRIQGQQQIIGGLDIIVKRNYYGRQLNSFETYIDLKSTGIEKLRAKFIRAPKIIDVGEEVETLATFEDLGQENIVALRQGKILGTTFHAELDSDNRLHKYFVSML